jgi:hypothetical protein
LYTSSVLRGALRFSNKINLLPIKKKKGQKSTAYAMQAIKDITNSTDDI